MHSPYIFVRFPLKLHKKKERTLKITLTLTTGMDGSFSEFFDPSTPSYYPFHDPTSHDVIDLDYFKDAESLNFTRFEFISLKTYDQVLDLYDKVRVYAYIERHAYVLLYVSDVCICI